MGMAQHELLNVSRHWPGAMATRGIVTGAWALAYWSEPARFHTLRQ
jgi:hypothetical protein